MKKNSSVFDLTRNINKKTQMTWKFPTMKQLSSFQWLSKSTATHTFLSNSFIFLYCISWYHSLLLFFWYCLNPACLLWVPWVLFYLAITISVMNVFVFLHICHISLFLFFYSDPLNPYLFPVSRLVTWCIVLVEEHFCILHSTLSTVFPFLR